MVNIESFRHLYPFKSNFLQIGEYKYHYIDEGQGEVLLMLHGNPTWSFYYRNLILYFSKKYRVIAPDHMGCGLSDKPQKYPYTLSTHIKNLERLIENLKLTHITLVVHDWGGPIGFGAAIEHPELFKRFVIFNSAAFLNSEYDLQMPNRIRICKYPGIGQLAIRVFNSFARGGLWMAATHKENLSRDVKRGYLAPYNNYKNRIANLRFVQDIPWTPKVPSFPIFEKITSCLKLFKSQPMLIIWGEKDFCFTHRFLMAWEDYFPHASVKLIPDAGHYVIEDAYERIIPWVELFLFRHKI